jgi:prevent-host-death family protein
MTVMVSVHEAKSQLSRLLAEINESGSSIIICNRGKPVADLTPHRRRCRTEVHPHMSRIQVNYNPTEPLAKEEWPEEDR